MKRLVAVVLLLASVASAQTDSEKKKAAERKTVLIFDEGDLIGADAEAPLIDDVFVMNRRPGFKSIIQLRENFKDKLMQSVNDL